MSKAWAAGGGLGVAVIALAAQLVMPAEGESFTPYRDPVGIPTVCFGETHAEMRTYTHAECVTMLNNSLAVHGQGLAACMDTTLPAHQQAAALSFGYNVGVSKACGSTFMRKLNARDPSACAELDKWVLAGGKKLPGLVTRRAHERAMCEGRPS